MFPPRSGSGGGDVSRGRVEKNSRWCTKKVTCLGAGRDEDVSKVHSNSNSVVINKVFKLVVDNVLGTSNSQDNGQLP